MKKTTTMRIGVALLVLALTTGCAGMSTQQQRALSGGRRSHRSACRQSHHRGDRGRCCGNRHRGSLGRPPKIDPVTLKMHKGKEGKI